MSDRDPSKKISAAAIQSLKEALTHAYWYKSDLRSFLNHTISEPSILSRVSWDEYKRNIVASVVDFLAKNEDVYQRHLLRLMTETAQINDLSHLAKLDDGKKKVADAKAAIDGLRSQIQGHLDLVGEEKAIEKRRAESHDRLMAVLEGRIDLIQLLLRKRREASQKGNIYLKIHEILTLTSK